MRVSNYIITSFLVVITGMTLGLFIDSKHHENDVNFSQTTEFALPEFSVVVAENKAHFSINQHETYGWVVSGKNGEAIIEDWYRIDGDTLYVRSTPSSHRFILNVSNLAFIIAREESTVYIWEMNDPGISRFSIEAFDHSSIYLRNMKASSLSIGLNLSKAYIYSGNQIDELQVNLSDNASLSTEGKGVQKLMIEKDSSSKCSVY